MTVQAAIKILVKKVAGAYKRDLVRFKASGRTAKEITTETDKLSGQVLAPSHIYTLMFGRKPGKFPPISAILQWIRDKRIKPNNPKTTDRQLAYVFARSIALRGNRVYQGKVDPLNVDEQIEKYVKEFQQSVGKQVAETIIKQKQ